MKRLLREPLVHFLVAGAALVAASSLWSDGDVPRDDEIVVSAGQIEHLATRFARTWQRPPTLEELEGLVDEHVKEEVAYREGLALGLDGDDTIIRRRIRQKLDFIASDLASLAEPSDEDLAEYLADNPDDFRTQPRFTFVHVFLDPGLRGKDLEADALRLKDRLNRDPGRDTLELGDRTMVAPVQNRVSPRQVSSMFGHDFAVKLDSLASSARHSPTGSDTQAAPSDGPWLGPFPSGYGLHLVRIDSVEAARLPALGEIRATVRREWDNALRTEAKKQFYEGLIERYDVSVEWPQALGSEEGAQ